MAPKQSAERAAGGLQQHRGLPAQPGPWCPGSGVRRRASSAGVSCLLTLSSRVSLSARLAHSDPFKGPPAPFPSTPLFRQAWLPPGDPHGETRPHCHQGLRRHFQQKLNVLSITGMWDCGPQTAAKCPTSGMPSPTRGTWPLLPAAFGLGAELRVQPGYVQGPWGWRGRGEAPARPPGLAGSTPQQGLSVLSQGQGRAPTALHPVSCLPWPRP